MCLGLRLRSGQLLNDMNKPVEITAEEFQDAPSVLISYGGGLGGSHTTYSLCKCVRVKDSVVHFYGYSAGDAAPNDKSPMFKVDGELWMFSCGYWPDHRIANLRQQLLAGNMDAAMVEYRATDTNHVVHKAKLQQVSACGNWIAKNYLD